MYEHLKNLDKDSIEFVTEAAICQFEIDRMSIENELNRAVKTFNVTEKADLKEGLKLSKEKVNKFSKAMTSMLKASAATIGRSLDALSNKMSGKEGGNINDYLNSKAGEIRLDHDIKKIQEDVRRTAIEGDKLVQAIAKGTNISDETVNDFVAKTKNVVENNSEAIITAAAASTIYATQISIYDDMKKRYGENGVFQQCELMADQSKASRIMNSVTNMANKESRIFSIFMDKYDKLENKK